MNPIEAKPLHEYQLIDLLKVWKVYRKLIIYFTSFCIVTSLIVAFLLPEYFESRTILYPISLNMVDRNIIFGQQQGQSDFSYFGDKFDANRIIQAANSNEVINYIIEKHDLKKHYGFRENDKYLYTKVKEEFLENYHAIRNDKDAIEITLIDTDKDKCAKMINDITLKVDEIATKPVSETKSKIIKMLELGYSNKIEELAKSTNATEKVNLNSEIKQLSEALTQYRVSNNEKLTSITVLEKAIPAEKRSKPIRWLIVLLSSLGGLIVVLLSTIIVTQYKFIKQKL